MPKYLADPGFGPKPNREYRGL